jgi:methylase of polypeptide subunit release factors
VCLRRVAHYEQQIVRDAPLVAQTALVIPTTTLGSRYIATDVNPAAVASTERTAAENGVDGVRAIRSDLVTAVADDIAGRVDVLLFNPPYVVTPSSEVGTADIAAAWAGGTNGREVTDRLLPLVPTLLTPETGRTCSTTRLVRVGWVLHRDVLCHLPDVLRSCIVSTLGVHAALLEYHFHERLDHHEHHCHERLDTVHALQVCLTTTR